MNATGRPPILARAMTMPSFVRSARSVSVPGGVWSAPLGVHVFVRRAVLIGWHCPRNTYDVEFSVGVPPPGSQRSTAKVSMMSWPADVALQA